MKICVACPQVNNLSTVQIINTKNTKMIPMSLHLVKLTFVARPLDDLYEKA
jgi:hypothetical protein